MTTNKYHHDTRRRMALTFEAAQDTEKLEMGRIRREIHLTPLAAEGSVPLHGPNKCHVLILGRWLGRHLRGVPEKSEKTMSF